MDTINDSVKEYYAKRFTGLNRVAAISMGAEHSLTAGWSTSADFS